MIIQISYQNLKKKLLNKKFKKDLKIEIIILNQNQLLIKIKQKIFQKNQKYLKTIVK